MDLTEYLCCPCFRFPFSPLHFLVAFYFSILFYLYLISYITGGRRCCVQSETRYTFIRSIAIIVHTYLPSIFLQARPIFECRFASYRRRRNYSLQYTRHMSVCPIITVVLTSPLCRRSKLHHLFSAAASRICGSTSILPVCKPSNARS
jgi:hypothetical protein